MFWIMGIGIFIGVFIVPYPDIRQCEENGGAWSRLFDGGCMMDPDTCRAADGIVMCVGEMHDILKGGQLSCTEGCYFK